MFGPFFQRFRHNGVVGIAYRLFDDFPSLVPAVAIIVEHNSHKLGDTKCGVSVVDVDCYHISEVVKVGVELQVVFEDRLNGCGNKEILLFQS